MKLYIENMDCPVEKGEIERAFTDNTRIESLDFNLENRTLTVELKNKLDTDWFVSELSRLGFPAIDITAQKKRKEKSPWPILILALSLAFTAEITEILIPTKEILILVLSLSAIFLAGFRTLRQGLKNLFHLRFTMATLIGVAIVGALALHKWPEAAMVMTLFEVGEALEGSSYKKARRAIYGLMQNDTTTVPLYVHGTWQNASASSIHPGTLFRVAPGEKIVADGIILEGTASVNEAAITGESHYITKTKGTTVLAGSIVLDCALSIRASKAPCDSMAARIVRFIEKAEKEKAPVQSFIEKFASIYTPLVFIASIATFIVCFTLSLPIKESFYRALTLLVIACPCALVISTPVAIVSALSAAAKKGLLVKGGIALEKARLLKNICIDKTGTLTEGKPRLVTLYQKENAGPGICDRTYALAFESTHPLSQALKRSLEPQVTETLKVSAVKAIPGYGLEGKVENTTLRLTNKAWLTLHKVPLSEKEEMFFATETRLGRTVVALSDLFGILALFSFEDALRSDVKNALKKIKQEHLTAYLLTGDTKESAERVARELNLEAIHAELLPEDKFRLVSRLEEKAPTAMVGDGINDAPALARASIGFAMGEKGTATAIEAADVTLLDNSIEKIAWFKALSRKTYRTIVENVVFALGIKAIFTLVALCGLASMWMAVFADTGVCLITVCWALRLRNAA